MARPSIPTRNGRRGKVKVDSDLSLCMASYAPSPCMRRRGCGWTWKETGAKLIIAKTWRGGRVQQNSQMWLAGKAMRSLLRAIHAILVEWVKKASVTGAFTCPTEHFHHCHREDLDSTRSR